MTAGPIIAEPMTQLECLDREKLMEYLSGWSDPESSAAIEVHLQACQKCEQSLSDLESQLDPLPEFSRRPAETESTTSSDLAIASALLNAKQLGQPTTSRSADSWEPPPGDIGAYELLRPIGRGGMGSVYLAKHRQLQKQVAIKLLPTSASFPQSLATRFQREIRAAGGLSHPSIVNATDAGEHHGTHYLVMEHIDGMDLSRVAKSVRQIAFADACEIVRQTATGLSHAHAMGIVHRDIKPSNLMLSSQGLVKILDFGLARHSLWDEASAELTTVGQLMGTLDYMAPEQVDRPEGVDYRADIYSLGATLFRLLCGHAPLAVAPNMSPLTKLRMLATQEAARLSTLRADVPEALSHLVASMLARNPDERPASAAHVAELLKPFCKGADLRALATVASQAKQSETEIESEFLNASQPALLPVLSQVMSNASASSPPLPSYSGGNRNRLKWFIAAAALPLLALAGVFITLETQKGKLVIESESANVHVKLLRDGTVYEQFKIEPGTKETRLYAGKYEVTIDGASDGIYVDGSEFEVRQGKTTIARIRQTSKASTVTAKASTATDIPIPKEATDEYRLKIGDEVSLSSLSDDSIKRERVPVMPDGTIVVPLLKRPVAAAGKTFPALRQELEVAYSPYIVKPAIDVLPVKFGATSAEPLYDGKPLSHWLDILIRDKSETVLNKSVKAIYSMVNDENSKEITDQLMVNLPSLRKSLESTIGLYPVVEILRSANKGSEYSKMLARSLERGDLAFRKILLRNFAFGPVTPQEFEAVGNWLDQNVFSENSSELLLEAADFCLSCLAKSNMSNEDRRELFLRLESCKQLGESYWFFKASSKHALWYRDSEETKVPVPLPSALEQALTILRNVESDTKDIALAAAWLQTREPKHPELHEEIANAIASQLSRILANRNSFSRVESIDHWLGMELSLSTKNGAELAGVKIVTNVRPTKYTRFQERLILTIELLALAKQYPSKEISGLIEESIVYIRRFENPNCDTFERELFSARETKPTLLWPSLESKDLRLTKEFWGAFLIYLYAKDLKKQLSGEDLSDAKVEQVSEPKATAMPSPKFKGRSVDEWLALLQVEQSAEGQSDAFVGLTGLFNEADSPRILTATLENLRSKRGVGDDKAVAKKLENGFALLRLCAGAGYGKLLADELTKLNADWSNRILNMLCVREGQWLPEHEFFLKWLADSEHKTAVPISAFLYGILADRSLPQPILETGFEVARQRYGDEFFLWRPIGEAKDGYSILTPRIIDLAIATLENEASEPNRVALAASLLVEMTSSIEIDKMESVARCVEKRLFALTKDMARLTAITSPTEATIAPAYASKWQLQYFMSSPSFAKNSEIMSMLALIYHLGSPASPDQAVREVIQATAVARQNCDRTLAERTGKQVLVLEWPFGEHQWKDTPEDIRKQSQDEWRAACVNNFAESILQSIYSRKAHEAETRDPRILAKLPQAYRDFAKWNNWGLGEIARERLKAIDAVRHDQKKEFSLLRYRDADSDRNGAVSVLEYAERLAEFANSADGSFNSQP